MTKAKSTTRREFVQRSATALAVGAAIPAALVTKTAQAGEPDPVFALIEQHKTAMAEYVRLVEANEKSDEAYELVDDAQTALLTTRPTTVAGAAAVLAYVASFWIEGDESGEKGLPIYETLAHDEMLGAGDGFLPMIADALQRLTVA